MEESSRSAGKRKVIMAAATEAFLRNGYRGTSMDEIAAAAAVSKQTVYKHFSDKENLFRDIISGTVGVAHERMAEVTRALRDTEDLEGDLRAMGRQFVASVVTPDVLQLRRLIIGEAGRFPELGRAYWEGAFVGVLSTLADGLAHLGERGLLKIDDPQSAAAHLAGLILWIPMNRAMFCGPGETFTGRELHRFADDGIRAFLSAYGRA